MIGFITDGPAGLVLFALALGPAFNHRRAADGLRSATNEGDLITTGAIGWAITGDPTGAPDWVRDIALVGEGPGWFEPGVVRRVHGDLSTLVGGVAALLGQGEHPLAMAGVARHSSYRTDP